MTALTSNDSAVLQALFDAESSPSSTINIDPTLPPLPQNLQINSKDHEALSTSERSIVGSLQNTSNDDGTSLATIQTAIESLNTLIEEHPTYPSAYVNRAQAFRMLIDINPPKQAEIAEVGVDDPLNRVFADLDRAITLCTPSSPADPVSPAQARILADAHTHRGYLLLKAAREKKGGCGGGEGRPKTGGSEQVWELGSGQSEEMASRDFFLGGGYGNKIAQQLAVQTNPYAKMCGAIVKGAMKKEAEGGGFESSVHP